MEKRFRIKRLEIIIGLNRPLGVLPYLFIGTDKPYNRFCVWFGWLTLDIEFRLYNK